jgi:hypothetical protein
MSSSTIDQAASNGTDNNSDAPSAPREHGIHRVREQVIYSLTGLAESALYEAERLVHEITTTASRRILDHDGSKGTEPVDTAKIADITAEALDCVDVAAEYLSRLSTDIRTAQDEHPF